MDFFFGDHAETVSSSFDLKVPQVPLLDWFLTCRYCATPGAFTVVKVVDVSVVAQRQSPWSCSDNHRDSPVAVLTR